MPKSKRRATRPRKGTSNARRRAAELQHGQTSRRGTSTFWLAGAAVVLVIAVAAAYLVAKASGGTTSAPTLTPAPAASSTAEPTMARGIDGIPCNDMNIGYHVHAHLQILLRGREVAVPANIGIDDNTCVYYLHTHDNSGELHIEAPTYRRFTLGNFFDIWGQTLSRRHIGTIPIKPTETIRVYVDGKVYRGDPRSIQLVAHRLIALEIGPPFVKPSGFDFQGD